MRKIDDVIKEVIKVEDLPNDLKKQLNYILKERVAYCPPESMGLMWRECQYAINAYMPQDPNNLNSWQKSFLKIWTGKDW